MLLLTVALDIAVVFSWGQEKTVTDVSRSREGSTGAAFWEGWAYMAGSPILSVPHNSYSAATAINHVTQILPERDKSTRRLVLKRL
jgi:hypothetical protein